MIDISNELKVIRSEDDGETVIDAIISALNKLNIDELVDISSALMVIKHDPIGKNVAGLKKGIARALYVLSQYNPKRPSILSKDDYEASTTASNMLYLILRDDKFMALPLDSNMTVDFNSDPWVMTIDSQWDLVPGLVKNALNSMTADFLEIIIPKNFSVTTIPEVQFEGTNIVRVKINLPSYTVQDRAFQDCSKLASVDLGAGITGLAPSVFDGCENLRTIIINKPYGSVLGAPWGAPNHTAVLWTG